MREDRRALLRTLVLAPLAGIASCGRDGDAPLLPSETAVPLTALPPGRRVTVIHRGHPVEVVRGADGSLTALSLLCTHMGCTVQWQETLARYWCPCHLGTYDRTGAVTGGPPPGPLRQVAARLAGDAVVLG